MEEGRQIDQEVCGELERAGDMVHGLLCIVAHDSGYAARDYLH